MQTEHHGSPRYGGVHHETAALANALDRGGLDPTGTGALSEALLLGIGGGIGLHYGILRTDHGVRFRLGTRYSAAQTGDAFLGGICDRIGLAASIISTHSPEEAENALVDAIAAHKPTLVWTEQASLPYWRLPGPLVAGQPHVVGVASFDEDADEFELDDASMCPIAIDAPRLRHARRANPGLAHRMLRVDGHVRVADLRRASIEGILLGASTQLHPPIRSMGVAGMRTWARRVRDTTTQHGWLSLMGRGPRLYEALLATFHGIETDGTGGGALRPLQSEFLAELAVLLDGTPRAAGLRALSIEVRALGAWWKELAWTALPDEVPLFAEARGCLLDRDAAFRAQGLDALDTIGRSGRRLDEIAQELGEGFPLSMADTRALLDGLGERIDQIADREESISRRLLEIARIGAS